MPSDPSRRGFLLLVSFALLLSQASWGSDWQPDCRVHVANLSKHELLIHGHAYPDDQSNGVVRLGRHQGWPPTEVVLDWDGPAVAIRPGETLCLCLEYEPMADRESTFTFTQAGRPVGLLRFQLIPDHGQGPAAFLERHPPDHWKVGEGPVFSYLGSVQKP